MCNLERLFTEGNRVLTIRLIPFFSVELLITSWGFKYRILETYLLLFGEGLGRIFGVTLSESLCGEIG